MKIIDRTNKIKKDFPALLIKHMGIISSACKAAGINRATYYQWRDSDPEFFAACLEAYDERIDYAESKLLKCIEKEDTTAIIYFLKTQARHRGYNEKVEHQHYGDKDKDPIMQDVTNSLNDSDRAILDRYYIKRLKAEKEVE